MIFAHIRNNFAEAFFPRLSEWVAAGVLFALGWMLSSNETLMSSASTQAYRFMLSVADQQTWAWLLMCFGFARLVVMIINGGWRRTPHARVVSAFLSCFIWAQLMVSFAAVPGFALVMAGGYLALDLCNILRAARDARTVDDSFARHVP